MVPYTIPATPFGNHIGQIRLLVSLPQMLWVAAFRVIANVHQAGLRPLPCVKIPRHAMRQAGSGSGYANNAVSFFVERPTPLHAPAIDRRTPFFKPFGKGRRQIHLIPQTDINLQRIGLLVLIA